MGFVRVSQPAFTGEEAHVRRMFGFGRVGLQVGHVLPLWNRGQRRWNVRERRQQQVEDEAPLCSEGEMEVDHGRERLVDEPAKPA